MSQELYLPQSDFLLLRVTGVLLHKRVNYRKNAIDQKHNIIYYTILYHNLIPKGKKHDDVHNPYIASQETLYNSAMEWNNSAAEVAPTSFHLHQKRIEPFLFVVYI